MALNTFSPPKPPSRQTARVQRLSRDLIATFGDGYEQRGVDGLNNLALSIPLIWAYLSLSEAQTIASFLDGQTRATPFYYTLPWESAPRKWRIGGSDSSPLYVIDKSRGITWSVEVTFQECFDTQS